MNTTKLSLVHRMLYAGVKLDALSGQVQAYKTSTNRTFHGYGTCYRGRSWRNPLKEVDVDPIKVTASSACPDCFDRLVTVNPVWATGFQTLGNAIQEEDARTIQAALRRSSKKVTPEDAAMLALTLEQTATRAARAAAAISGPAKHEAILLERRLTTRASELRSLFMGSGARDQVLREATALMAVLDVKERRGYSTTTWRTGELPSLSMNTWHADGLAEEAARRFVTLVGTDGLALEEAPSALEGWVRTQVTLSHNSPQLNFVPTRGPEPDQTINDWLEVAWSDRITSVVGSVTDEWVERYRAITARRAELSLVSILSTTTPPADDFGKRVLLSLIEAFAVSRTSIRTALVMPTDLVQVLVFLNGRYSPQPLKCELGSSTLEEARAAAILLDPDNGGAFTTPEEALVAARALS